ncbi:hypothetical protein CORT_0B06040 [Candida orthopsilosis Co 90-125]|uniref:Uncharacterized protein n=1 Tax=Candida orthopsilosis (strain 90-125) TaxID=1136231 RepID=H8WZW8_CANO9|nr:hypothetical protein CORT_0B06040 [Candida orthopsilosis Co 90-125]CCG22313.1 hypothetical protein CORT_0B06040 [Candida orthopsilosis Co 90-125]
MTYTRQQKQALISHLKLERSRIAKQNEEVLNKATQQTYQKVIRRLNRVSVSLRQVTLKDVLQVEMRKKLEARSLIRDIQELKKNVLKQKLA